MIKWIRTKPGEYHSEDQKYKIVRESQYTWTLFRSDRQDWSYTNWALRLCKEEAEKIDEEQKHPTSRTCEKYERKQR